MNASATEAIDQYGVVGHPVAHSWSPFIHGLFSRETGQAMSYRLYDFAPGEFHERVREFFRQGGRGLNITLPYKIAAVDVADDLTARAAHAGAVNTFAVRNDGSILGDNTDGTGLVRDLCDNLGIVITHRRILMIGASLPIAPRNGRSRSHGPSRSSVRPREWASATLPAEPTISSSTQLPPA
jgi:shikimate dehydrogenase